MWITGTLLLTNAAFIGVIFARTNYSNCASNLGTLERALYEMEGNLFELNEIFYPPSLLPTRFIKVNYTFVNGDSSMTCTNVTYIWAVGEILFLQPPTLFKFHSLFFYFPNNKLTVLDLTLPYACLPLIEGIDHLCSCSNDSMMLDVLTQQLDIYARFTNQDNIQRSNTFARAVCGGELFDTYYSGKRSDYTYIIVAATIVGPFLLQLLLVLAAILSCFVPEKKEKVFFKSMKPKPRPKRLIALIVIGAMASIYILILDVLAVNVVRTSMHEYTEEYDDFVARTPETLMPVNLWVTYWTLICDTSSILYFIIYFILIVTDRFKKNGINAWCKKKKCHSPQPLYLLLTPIACFTSHLGYVILAWLTEPSRSTTTLILYYFIFFYLFLIIQKSYKVADRFIVDRLIGKKFAKAKVSEENEDYKQGKQDLLNLEQSETEDTRMVISLIIQSILGIFYLGIAVVFILIVYLVPLASEDLFTYLFNVIQFMIIVLSTQFAYKLLAGKKFSLKGIVMTIIKEMAKDGDYKDYKNEDSMVKAAGKLLAKEILNPHVKMLKEKYSSLKKGENGGSAIEYNGGSTLQESGDQTQDVESHFQEKEKEYYELTEVKGKKEEETELLPAEST